MTDIRLINEMRELTKVVRALTARIASLEGAIVDCPHIDHARPQAGPNAADLSHDDINAMSGESLQAWLGDKTVGSDERAARIGKFVMAGQRGGSGKPPRPDKDEDPIKHLKNRRLETLNHEERALLFNHLGVGRDAMKAAKQ